MLLNPNSEKQPAAVILGCSDETLTDDEKAFFRDADPLGFILFARNCKTPDQIRALVSELRETVGRDAPVLIDQEGGRVARLVPPHWSAMPPMRVFGDLYQQDQEKAREAIRINTALLAVMLADLGITVDCAPVVDVPVPGADDIIGDRAFSECAREISDMGAVCSEAFLDNGITPIMKHIPGHGRATQDSHKALPVVCEHKETLSKTDFVPFKDLSSAPFGKAIWAMVAHVCYSEFDPNLPASVSSTVIRDVIRGEIGFDGVLIADDVGMDALTGDLAERTAATLCSGNDLTLHCSGEFHEMLRVACALRSMDAEGVRRFNAAEEVRASCHDEWKNKDPRELHARLNELTGWTAAA